jgi:hypothetical protein
LRSSGSKHIPTTLCSSEALSARERFGHRPGLHALQAPFVSSLAVVVDAEVAPGTWAEAPSGS